MRMDQCSSSEAMSTLWRSETGAAGALGAFVTLVVSAAGLAVFDTRSGAGKVTPRRAKSSAAIRCASRSNASGHSTGISVN
jgi:hypothetical protein